MVFVDVVWGEHKPIVNECQGLKKPTETTGKAHGLYLNSGDCSGESWGKNVGKHKKNGTIIVGRWAKSHDHPIEIYQGVYQMLPIAFQLVQDFVHP